MRHCSEIPFKQSVRLLSALADERLGQSNDLEKLVDILKDAEKLEDRRNEILHSVWGGGGDAPVRIKSRIRGRKLSLDMDERLTAGQLDAVASRIEAVHLDLQTLLFDILKADTPKAAPRLRGSGRASQSR